MEGFSSFLKYFLKILFTNNLVEPLSVVFLFSRFEGELEKDLHSKELELDRLRQLKDQLSALLTSERAAAVEAEFQAVEMQVVQLRNKVADMLTSLRQLAHEEQLLEKQLKACILDLKSLFFSFLGSIFYYLFIDYYLFAVSGVEDVAGRDGKQSKPASHLPFY